MRRLVVLVASIVLLDTMLYAALTPLLPDFVERFGLSKTGAGLLVASYAIGVLAGAIPAGIFSARVGAKPAALAGLIVMGVASGGFAYADSAWGLGIARFVQGLGSALSWAGGLAWLIGSAPRSRRGELLGTALGAAIVGALLGPVLGGFASIVGEHIAFVGVAVVTLAVAIMGAQLPGIELEESSMAAVGRALRDKRFLFGLWLMLLAALLFGVLSVISSLDLDRLGWTAVAIGGLYFFNASFEAVFNVFVGRAVDRRGTLPVLRLALPVGIVASVALGWADNAWLIAALAFLGAISWGALFTPGMVLLSSGADGVGLPQGLAFGIMNGGWALGAIIGPAVGGALSDIGGDFLAYGLGALASAFTLFLVVSYKPLGTQAQRVPDPVR
jgi:MFS family permease